MPDTATQPKIKGMPSSVLIDPKGQIVFVHTGFTETSPGEIEPQIKLALKGER